jgi:hypothetical protein
MNKLWVERFKLLTSPFRMLPSFIIPGETKCGTTTFFRCLEQHPHIASPDKKEPNNFIRYGGTSIFCKMHFPLYISKILNPKLITGEASVEYLSKRDTPIAIHSLLPNIKLIILLRNPLRRALSDYLMMKDSGSESDTFDSAVRNSIAWLNDDSLRRLVNVATRADDTPLRYITKGCYARTLAPWLKTFPVENIKVIRSETFFLDPQRVLDETFEFLGIDRFTIKDVPHHRKARSSIPVKKETFQILDDYFSPYNEELQRMLGSEFNWVDDTADLLESCD